MIIETNSLSMAEAKELVGDNEVVDSFIKRFTKVTPADAKKIREQIRKMDLLRVKENDISKIIDILPETKEDLNKIFVDSSLDEEETNKILDVIKQFK